MKIILRQIVLNLILVGLLFLGASCVGYHGTQSDSRTVQSTENLVYLDLLLKGWIPCEAISAEQLPSGRMRVYARFANKQNNTAECQIKLRFKGADGRIMDDTGWMPLILPRREVTQFEHTSLVAGAKDFIVMLREAKQ